VTGPLYASFLGSWTLIAESCRYEQGDPPRSGQYRIEEVEPGHVAFVAQWVDASGRERRITLRGPADGSRVPFSGGDLADELAIEAVSARELNSYAYFRGVERMVAQRQLDDTGQAMRITQLVRLPDGSRPANVSIYRRMPENSPFTEGRRS